VGQNEIRYQLRGEDDQPSQVFRTTPIFDLELPKLESEGVEFAAPHIKWLVYSLLGGTPLIFVAIWQFFYALAAVADLKESSHQEGQGL